MQDTIAAISTAKSPGGIGIVRISGKSARQIAAAVFRPAGGKRLESLGGYQALFGRVHDASGEFDEAVALVFQAPRSYTGEDVVELSCHGGLYLLTRLLHAVLHAGARPAGPGEFTRRAFLNGKMDLTEAEAVMGLISANGAAAARAALAAKDGALSTKLNQVRDALVEAAAWLSAWADYPEEDIPAVERGQLEQRLRAQLDKMAALLHQYEAGRVVREGVETVIAGRPNVGKSTLMNLLSGRQSSIVTEIPGTTRDVVEDTVRLGDVVLRLCDTAGLRASEDRVEQAGIELARQRLDRAELVLAVLDASEPFTKADADFLDSFAGRPMVAVVNKTDLPQQLDHHELEQHAREVVYLSAKEGEGADRLTAAVTRVLGAEEFDPSAGMLATERQWACAGRCKKELEACLSALREGVTLDAVSVCLDAALDALLELTGERVTDTVTDAVFHQFCVGK